MYGFVTRDPPRRLNFPAQSRGHVEEAVTDRRWTPSTSRCPWRCTRTPPSRLCALETRALRKAHGYRLRAGAADGGRSEHFQRFLGVSYYRRLYPKLIRAKHSSPRAPSAGRCWPRPTATDGPKSWKGAMADESRHGRRRPALRHRLASYRRHEFPLRQGGARLRLLSNTVHRMSVEDSATVLMQFPVGCTV